MKYLLILLIVIFSGSTLYGQIMPSEGSKLNYRLAGFFVSKESHANTYRFEIAEGHYTSPEEFTSRKIIVKSTKENAIILKLPGFGQRYTWRVVYLKNKTTRKTSPLYHFETDILPIVDTSRYRLRIIDAAKTNKDLLVVLDTRVMYDMDGTPLWYLPNIPGVLDDVTVTRDLKPTPFGTFTFLKDNRAFEVDYNGKVLWEAPLAAVRADSQANYHHDFTRLKNGNYMVADQEDINVTDSAGNTQMLKWGTLVEFDTSGKVVWYWRSGNYFLNSPKYRQPKGQYSVNTHLNGFFFDEKRQVIYLSFRNISTILKISYPSGNALADYDGTLGPLFKAQHHCQVNKKGDLYLFNNNTDKGRGRSSDQPSSIVILKSQKNNLLKKKWEYSCDIDNQAAPVSQGGGSVYELKDGAILSCMGFTPRIFIVAKNKELIWNALAERKQDNNWIPYAQYRTSYIKNTDELQKLIFRNIALQQW